MASADLPGGGQLKAIRWQPIRRVFVFQEPQAFGGGGFLAVYGLLCSVVVKAASMGC